MKRVIKILHLIEDGVLVGMLLLMIGMAVLQIILRNTFGTGLVWGETLVRILTLWIGLIGATVASRTGNHINIDIITRYLPQRMKTCVISIMNLFASIICFGMAWVSLSFVRTEYQFGEIAFANIPSWLCESIIPVAFLIIAVRYVILTGIELKNLVRSGLNFP